MKTIQKHGIPTVEQYHVSKESDLEKARQKTGFPAAIKMVSSTVSHKTDKGGVKLNIHSLEEARLAFRELQQIKGFESALLQKQLKGTEVIVGGKLDEQFGPTILFGLGGIFVEIFQDVSIRICPISEKDAGKMITEIKGYKILSGARGQKPANLKAIKDVLLKTSKIMLEGKTKELDINPLIVTEKKAVAVDARIVE